MRSFGKLILKPYEGSGAAEAKVVSGYATVSQRHKMVGLELLMDSTILIGNSLHTIKKGSVAFFVEEQLAATASKWTKQKFSSEGVDGEFIVADYQLAVYFNETE